MARGRPSTRGTPKASSTADVSREPSTASGRMTRSAVTRTQAASSASTPAPSTEVQTASGSRPRGRPRKSVAAVDESPAAQSPVPDVVPARRRGRPSKVLVAESESLRAKYQPQRQATMSKLRLWFLVLLPHVLLIVSESCAIVRIR